MAKQKNQKSEGKIPLDWNRTVKHLESLQTINEKIKFLIKQKTDYKQSVSGFDFSDWNETPFDKKCELEIQKLRQYAELEATDFSSKSKQQLEGFTNSQLVLIFYYFFKQNGLEPRINIDIAPIAKFIHLVTGKEFKATTHSDFYTKLRTVPNFKTDKELINDLEFIKPMFQSVQLNEIVKMIENEIDKARNEIKQQRKNKI